MANVGWIFYLVDGNDRYVVHVSEPDHDAAIKLIPTHLQGMTVTSEQTMSKPLNDFFPLGPGKAVVGKFLPNGS